MFVIRSLNFGFNLYNLNKLFLSASMQLDLLYKLSCWPIIQKVHCNIINYSNNISNCLFFYLFQYILILMVLFHPSLTVLYTLSNIQSYFFKLREWFPFVQTIFYLDSFTFIHKLRISTGLSPSLIMYSNIFDYLLN